MPLAVAAPSFGSGYLCPAGSPQANAARLPTPWPFTLPHKGQPTTRPSASSANANARGQPSVHPPLIVSRACAGPATAGDLLVRRPCFVLRPRSPAWLSKVPLHSSLRNKAYFPLRVDSIYCAAPMLLSLRAASLPFPSSLSGPRALHSGSYGSHAHPYACGILNQWLPAPPFRYVGAQRPYASAPKALGATHASFSRRRLYLRSLLSAGPKKMPTL